MATYRSEILSEQPAEALYEEFVDLQGFVTATINGFVQVLTAAKACRDAQQAYFDARRAGMSGHSELQASKKAEKILDDLVKFWSAEMAPPNPQTTLF